MFVTKAFAQDHAPDAVDAPHDAAGETHASTGHEASFPPFNGEFFPSQLLWLAITFGVFYYILKRTILPQIGGIVDGRRERIVADLDASQKMKGDADAAQAAYVQELAEARARSHKIAADAREHAKTSAEAERKRTEGDLDAKLAGAQARIADIKIRALADVGGIAEDVAQSILADVVKLDVGRDDVAGAVATARR